MKIILKAQIFRHKTEEEFIFGLTCDVYERESLYSVAFTLIALKYTINPSQLISHFTNLLLDV